MYSDRLHTRNVVVVCITVVVCIAMIAVLIARTSHDDAIDRRHRIDACQMLESETARAVCTVTVQ